MALPDKSLMCPNPNHGGLKKVVSEELEKSLRDEIAGFINARMNEVHDQIERLQDDVNTSFARFRELKASNDELSPSVAETIAGHLRGARDSGMQQVLEASAAEKTASGIAMLRAAIDDIDNQRTQADILGCSSIIPRDLLRVWHSLLYVAIRSAAGGHEVCRARLAMRLSQAFIYRFNPTLYWAKQSFHVELLVARLTLMPVITRCLRPSEMRRHREWLPFLSSFVVNP